MIVILWPQRDFSKPCCGGNVDTSRIGRLRLKWGLNSPPVAKQWNSQNVTILLTRKMWYFELGIFSFSWYVYCLTRVFLTSTLGCKLITRAFEPVTCGFELITLGSEVVTRNS